MTNRFKLLQEANLYLDSNFLIKATGKEKQMGAMRECKTRSGDAGEEERLFFGFFFILGYKRVTEFMPELFSSLVQRDKAEHAELIFRFTSLNISYSIFQCFRLAFLKHIISQLTDSQLK